MGGDAQPAEPTPSAAAGARSLVAETGVAPKDTDEADLAVPNRTIRHRLRHGRRVRLTAVGVVAVLVTVVAVVSWWPRHRPASTSPPSIPGHATSAAQAGAGYLAALAAGDSADLLAYLTARPPSTALITDAVLAESTRLNPITDITVLDSVESGDEGTATVQYRLGTTRVIDTYHVARSGDGLWRLAPRVPSRDGSWGAGSQTDDAGLGYVQITMPSGAAAAGLTLNGVPVGTQASVYLPPGTYRFDSTNPLLTSTQTLMLPGLARDLVDEEPALSYSQVSGSRQLSTLPVGLTPDGLRAVTDAVATATADCLDEARLVTSCGLVFTDYYEDHGYGSPVESTLRWSTEIGSVDLTQTTPTWASTGSDPGADDPTGLWVQWQPAEFEWVGVLGRMTMSNGQPAFYSDTLWGSSVDIADPDHLVVRLSWEFSRDPGGTEQP